MKIGNIVISRKFILTMTIIVLVVSAIVGLITTDEIVLAGATSANVTNNSYYLYTNQNWWTLSPFLYLSYFPDSI